MAKFGQNETKAFSPIDSKLLGTLAESPVEDSTPQPLPVIAEPVRPKPSVLADPKKNAAQAKPVMPQPTSAPTGKASSESERLTRVVRCLFTPSEEQEIRSLMNRLRESSGLTLGVSHLMRPFLSLLLQSEEALKDELAKAGLRRPINDKTALATFDRELAAVILAALQRTAPQDRR